MIIQTEEYRGLILSILKQEGLAEKNLIIVKNPTEYAAAKNIKGDFQRTTAFAYIPNMIVVLQSFISPDEVENIMQRICYPLNRGRRKFLERPNKFIEHLVRHEIEHLIYKKTQQQEKEAVDEAFKKMGFVESGSVF